MDVPEFLGLLALMLGAAKLAGWGAKLLGQPAVLGELAAGVVLGGSVIGCVDPQNEVLHLLAELGVVILLFEIGLETDLRKLLEIGGSATVVAIVGVTLPFALGYIACRLLGLGDLASIVAGATLTATSVGVTARVLSELQRLQDAEGQIILGAAIIDDVIGLVILAVVAGLTAGQAVTAIVILKTTAIAFGFLAGTLLIGRYVVPGLARLLARADLPGTPVTFALVLAFGIAWLASAAGSAMIIGAFAAGLLLRDTPQVREIERGVTSLGYFFVPLFFVAVGAAVDVRLFNPFNPANQQTLLVGSVLIVAAVLGKFLAGYTPFWFKGNKSVIGAGMIPRGEVGLIFAQMGLASGVLDRGLFSAVTLMVMVTTFLGPLLLKMLLPPRGQPRRSSKPHGIDELVSES